MKQELVCPYCGTEFEVDAKDDRAECPFCEEKIVIGEKSKR